MRSTVRAEDRGMDELTHSLDVQRRPEDELADPAARATPEADPHDRARWRLSPRGG